MTPVERSILQALRELDSAVKTMPVKGARPELTALFDRIDDLTRSLPAETAPDLRHYLHRKSYEKARFWLEGRDAENAHGECRRD